MRERVVYSPACLVARAVRDLRRPPQPSPAICAPPTQPATALRAGGTRRGPRCSIKTVAAAGAVNALIIDTFRFRDAGTRCINIDTNRFIPCVGQTSPGRLVVMRGGALHWILQVPAWNLPSQSRP
jgi:hypothetical protein